MSKAFEKSANIIRVTSPLFIYRTDQVISNRHKHCRCRMTLAEAWYAIFKSGFSFTVYPYLLRNQFLKDFQECREDRYRPEMVFGCWLIEIGLILAVFHALGKMEFSIQELPMAMIGPARYSSTSLINLTGMLSGAVEQSDLKLSIRVWSTSLCITCPRVNPLRCWSLGTGNSSISWNK